MKEFKIRITDIDYIILDDEINEYVEDHDLLYKHGNGPKEAWAEAEEAILEDLPEIIDTTVRCKDKDAIRTFIDDIIYDSARHMAQNWHYDILEEKDLS